MKAALFLAAASAVVAQNLSGQPSCATQCLLPAISAVCKDPTDQGCACGTGKAAIGATAAPCLLASCADQILTVQAVGDSLCSSYSAGLSGSSTGSGPASTSASTTQTTGGTSPTTTKASVTETTASITVGSNSTFTTRNPTSSTPTPQSTNAAAQPVVLGVGVLAAFLGAVAAL